MGVIKKQSLSNVVISYTGLGIGFLNVMILQPWMLKPDEIGLMRVLYAIAVLGGTIFPLGISGAIIRFLPSFRDKEKGHHGFLGTILLMAFTLFVLLSAVFLFSENTLLESYYAKAPLLKTYSLWVLPLIGMVGFSSLISIYLLADFQSVLVSWINDFFVRVFTLAIVVVYFFHWVDQRSFFLLFAGVYFFQLLALVLFSVYQNPSRTLLPDKAKWDAATRKSFASYSLAMALVTIAGMALKNIDVIIVGGMLNLEQVAVYSLAILVAGFIELPATSIGRIADAKISDAYQNKRNDEIEKIYYSTTRILSITGMYLFSMIGVCIGDLLTFLPSQFSAAAIPVIIIGAGAFSNMSTGINSSILYYTSQVRMGTILTIGLVILMVLLNLVLIPVLGIKGAAIANGISFVTFNFSKWLIIKKKFGWSPYGNWFFFSLAVMLVALGVGIFFPSHLMHPLLALGIKGMVISMLFLLLALRTQFYPEVKNLILQVYKGTIKKK